MRTVLGVLVVVTVLSGYSTSARAGACQEPSEVVAQITALETFAKDKTKRGEADDPGPWVCVVLGAAPYKARIAAACTTILDREPTETSCLTLAASAGLATLGTHDIIALLGARTEDPLNVKMHGFNKPELLGNLGDARGAAIITAEWLAGEPRAAARAKKKRDMSDWDTWRQFAAKALGTIGTPTEATFLLARVKAAKPKGVAKAITAAIAAIQARAATTTAP